MNRIAVKGSKDAKVVHAPVARNAHARVLDILKHRAHIGKHAVALGLSVPFVKQAHVSHVDGGNAPCAALCRRQKGIGASHKLTGAVETGERVDALGECAFVLDFGNAETVVVERSVYGANAAVEFVQNGRRLVNKALVVDRHDQACGGDDVAGNLDGF